MATSGATPNERTYNSINAQREEAQAAQSGFADMVRPGVTPNEKTH